MSLRHSNGTIHGDDLSSLVIVPRPFESREVSQGDLVGGIGRIESSLGGGDPPAISDTEVDRHQMGVTVVEPGIDQFKHAGTFGVLSVRIMQPFDDRDQFGIDARPRH